MEEAPAPMEEAPAPMEESPVEETPVEETPVEEGKEMGPPVPEAEQETKTGEGDMALPPQEKTGGKSRSVRGKKRNTSRNKRNKQRQYQSQYY